MEFEIGIDGLSENLDNVEFARPPPEPESLSHNIFACEFKNDS